MSKKNVEWEWKKLKDICEKGSSSIKQGDLKKNTGDYPIYGASGFIQNVDFYQQDKEYIGIVKDGSGVGRTMFLPAYSSVIGTLQYILPKEGNSIKFVNYALQNIDFSKLIQGAAIPHIYFKDYGEMDIAVPPLDEQERIVKVLDDAFEKIDAIKTTAETNLQNAKDLFQTTLANELTITDEKIKQGWKTFLFNEIFSLKSGDNLPTNKLKNGSFPVYGGNGIAGFHAEYNLDGDNILIGRVGALCGNVRNVKGKVWVTDNCFKLMYKDAILPLNAYVTYELSFANLRSYAKQAAQPVISNVALRDVVVTLPPLPIQKQIVAKLDSLSEKVKQLESNYKQVLADCDELKKAILKKAFNGEL